MATKKDQPIAHSAMSKSAAPSAINKSAAPSAMSKSPAPSALNKLAAQSAFNKGPARLKASPSASLLAATPTPTLTESKGGTPVTEEAEGHEPAVVPLTKAETFSNFLQGNGVRMAFVRTLVALYEEEEKPDDPLPYICDLMGKGLPTEEEVLEKQDELTILRAQHQSKLMENESLRFRLAKYITPPEENEGEDKDEFEFEYDPNNYNYLNAKLTTAEEEAGQDGDDEDVPTTKEG